jgi:hypothetical protein
MGITCIAYRRETFIIKAEIVTLLQVIIIRIFSYRTFRLHRHK